MTRALLLAAALVAVAGCSDDEPVATTGAPSVASSTAPPATAATTVGEDTGAPTTAGEATTGPVTTAVDTAAPTEPATSQPATDGGPPAASATLLAELSDPTDLAWREASTALFVALQGGEVVAIDDETTTTVLDMTELTAAGGERGLLGLAFHPTEPLAYVNYTNRGGDTVIDEYALGDDGSFDPASRREVLTIDQPYPNHNGGELLFGPDGYLYIGTGDGGSGGDPQRRASDLGTLLGKILRIDPTGDDPYAVPTDNPFAGDDAALPEIWSYGLRNPWRMSFDRVTGDLWIGDVGQGAWEEIDVATADSGGGRGVNFGWSAREGTHPYNDDVSADGALDPIYEYPHANGACSISAGVRYRGEAIPSLSGWFVFADLCTGVVQALSPDTGEIVDLDHLAQVSAVTEGPDGELYVLALDDGVYALR